MNGVSHGLLRRLLGTLKALPGLRRRAKQRLSWWFPTFTATLPAMERAVVRCVPAEPKLSVSLVLQDGKTRHLQRDQAEPLGQALARIANNVSKGHAKKAKKSKKAQTEADPGTPPLPLSQLVAVRLFSQDGEAVAEDVPNEEAWQDGTVLQIGETRYRVERNPPTLTEVQLPRSLMAGFPVCPKLQVEFGSPQDCLFRWYQEQKIDSAGAAAAAASDGWAEAPAGSERVFTPTNAHIGRRLKLVCIPGNSERRFGLPREVESIGPVEAGPGACTFEARHLYTKKVTGPGLIRMVTYNILADIYARTELSRTVLYPYCAPYSLELDYRQNLLKKELAGYSADIICLQEVDKSVFVDSLGPALDAFGLEGLFRIKEKQHEGLATFYRRDKFSLLGQHDIAFNQALLEDPLHRELRDKVATCPQFEESLLKRASALQVSVLQSRNDSSRKICVANTHLFWHPKGENIRLIQVAIALSHLKHVINDMYPATPLILCGDFNATPSTGTYTLVNSGSIAEDHESWDSEGKEQRCAMSLTHQFRLKSACGEPAYTNYVGGFHGCLDYIFIDANALEVEQVIPLPSHEEVTTHQALPSVSHPSDHIALICDIKWK
ncbi:2',5'-phosphodiesterase 12 [Python bivittatus]|uniref:2',5'-phosphodiesterase 12 n=1 Tax=Python bivittatus TaxID=176946 RepID=A0A9F2KUX6_PYTBI|nr:2',5'-phosphodiesterase 12 [Python bivittatus]